MKKLLLIAVGWMLLFQLTGASGALRLEGGAPTTRTTTRKTLHADTGYGGTVTVTIHSAGGVPSPGILANLKADQNPRQHALVWIFAGGINDLKLFGNNPGTRLYYQEQLEQACDYAALCNARLYLQEPTPVVKDLIEADPYWAGLDIPGGIQKMAGIVNAVALKKGVRVIRVYDDFLPRWGEWSYGDSVHPNSLGAQKLAQAWAGGIRIDLCHSASVYVAGDSIAGYVSPEVFLGEMIKNIPAACDPAWERYE